MDKNLWERILKGFRAKELNDLSSLIYAEQRRRAEKAVNEGRFEPLLETEAQLAQEGRWGDALRAYKNRVRCSAYMARAVIDTAKNSIPVENIPVES